MPYNNGIIASLPNLEEQMFICNNLDLNNLTDWTVNCKALRDSGEDQSAYFLSSTVVLGGYQKAANPPGYASFGNPSSRVFTLRPSFNLESKNLNKISASEAGIQQNNSGLELYKFGLYPRNTPNISEKDAADIIKNIEKFQLAGLSYTRDNAPYDAYNTGWTPEILQAFIADNRILVAAEGMPKGDNRILSNGRISKTGQLYLHEVKQLVLGKHERVRNLFAAEGIASGVRMNDKRPHDGGFKNTEGYWFLNTVLLPEIMQEFTPDFETYWNNNDIMEQIRYALANKYNFKVGYKDNEPIVVLGDFQKISQNYNKIVQNVKIM